MAAASNYRLARGSFTSPNVQNEKKEYPHQMAQQQQHGNRGARQQASPGQALTLRPEDLNLFLTNQVGGEISRAIPPAASLTAQAIIGQAVMAIRRSPLLQSCTHQSIAASVIYAAQVGLELATPQGLCYLIPYRKECTFQIGYKGLLALAYRSGKITSAKAEVVYSNDHFKYVQRGSGGDIFEYEKSLGAKRGEPQAAFLRVRYGQGIPDVIHVMRRDEIEHVRDTSSRSAYDTNKEGWSKTPEYLTGPWKDWADEMWKKTVTKNGLKSLDLRPELAMAIGADDEAMAKGTQQRPPMPEGIIEVRSWEVIERAQLSAPGTASTTAPPTGQPPPEPQGEAHVDPKLREDDYMPDPGKGLSLEINFTPEQRKWVLDTMRFIAKWNKRPLETWMGPGLLNQAHMEDFLRRWTATKGAFLDKMEELNTDAATVQQTAAEMQEAKK